MMLLTETGGEPDLPDLDPALQYFVDALFDAGPTSAAGMGAVPLTWADLEAWQRGTGVFFPPWQLRLIRKLSSEYLAESQAADAHDAPPPWNREITEDRRGRVAKHIRDVMRG
jgi:hypothetical protein